MPIHRTGSSLKQSRLQLEIVIVDFFGRDGEHLHPYRFIDEQPESLVGSFRFLNIVVIEQTIEAFLEGLQVRMEACPDHNAVGIDRPTVLAVTLPRRQH